MPARSGKGSNDSEHEAAAHGSGTATGASQSPALPSGAVAGPSGGTGRKARKRPARIESASDSVVFAIYTHTEERDRYRALADELKVTHGELLTLLLDMTQELLESGRLEVRFKTVTVRKTKPEYVLKPARAATE